MSPTLSLRTAAAGCWTSQPAAADCRLVLDRTRRVRRVAFDQGGGGRAEPVERGLVRHADGAPQARTGICQRGRRGRPGRENRYSHTRRLRTTGAGSKARTSTSVSE